MLKLHIILLILSCLEFTNAFPFSRDAGGPVDYKLLTECELNLQKRCIEVYSSEKTLLPNTDGKCDITKLWNCIMTEVKNTTCLVKDIGTVAYMKDFAKRLNNNYISKGECMDAKGRKEVLELFKPPEFGYNDTTAHIQEPPHFVSTGSGDFDSWGSDDSESGEMDYGVYEHSSGDSRST